MKSSPRNSNPTDSSKLYNRLTVAVIVVTFALVCTMLLALGHAATPFVTSESESGTISPPASAVTDSTASAGEAVKFAGAATPPPQPPVSSANPCVGAAAPAKWNHVVVVMFENRVYDTADKGSSGYGGWFGTASPVPYSMTLRSKCGTYLGWKDADSSVTGASAGKYASKPNYALLTSGVPVASSGIINDTYTTTTSVDNIYNRLNQSNKDAKDYYSGPASTTPCASSNFSGAYHDALRYYTNLGGQSASASTYCNTHDKPISQFMTDVNAGRLPAFSMILPTNSENGHDNSNTTADTWGQNFLTPLLDSAQYKSGDTAIFWIWDEDYPIPNVLIAPSIKPGSSPATPAGNPIGHYAALRTWQEMLGVTPLLGNTGQAPSLRNYYNGQ